MKHRFPLLASSASCLLAIGLLQSTAMARLYVADETLNQILIFPNNANGNTAPFVTIGGSNTGLSSPFGVATDANYIYVANYEGTQGNSVTVYPIDASGNVAPVATIIGSNTGLGNCEGIAVDANYIYVVNDGVTGYGLGSITVYPLTANGNVAPVATIGFPDADQGKVANNAQLADPMGIAVDATSIYVTNPSGDEGAGTV